MRARLALVQRLLRCTDRFHLKMSDDVGSEFTNNSTNNKFKWSVKVFLLYLNKIDLIKYFKKLKMSRYNSLRYMTER